MLSKEEITFFRGKMANHLAKIEGPTDLATRQWNKICSQAIFAASLVEFIGGLELKDDGPTILYGKGSDVSHQDIGHNLCLLKITTFIKENQ